MGVKGFCKFCLLRTLEIFVLFIVIATIPGLPPYVNYSKSYKVTPPKLEGKLALNNKLDSVELWHKGDLLGPEAFVDLDGELYTSLHSGDVVKLKGNHITPVVKFGKPCKEKYEEKLCGRPLGMSFDRNGYLYVADAYYGLFKVNVKTGDSEKLVSVTDEIEGKKPMLPNSVTVASNGDIYWTDSSTQFLLQDGVFDMFSDGSGRLIHYDAKTGRNRVLIKDLQFANGVALSENEDFVVVSETSRGRLHRYYLKGPKKDTSDIFIDNLPGFTDNLKTDGHGGFLVPLVVSVDADNPNPLQIFGPFPFLRKLVSRVLALPEAAVSLVDRYYPNWFCQHMEHFIGHFTSLPQFTKPKRVTILRLSQNGEILDALHTTSGKISDISEVHIFKDHLYLGSPFNDYIGRIPLSTIGWEHLKKPETHKQQVNTKEVPAAKPAPQKEAPKVKVETVHTVKNTETHPKASQPETPTTAKPIKTQTETKTAPTVESQKQTSTNNIKNSEKDTKARPTGESASPKKNVNSQSQPTTNGAKVAPNTQKVVSQQEKKASQESSTQKQPQQNTEKNARPNKQT